eukprot:CAMPEP_0117668120 /NCGR_PEP_ID=MMETSP0804-20121206/11358_1 /TAXON_ID=1074897 /ORGANISM="Tetraselmis astigmatica, Strain CCMP880" /LENGTH=497 /DNA_ID=CAMNT_0005475947 /DNA_START=168 /DNA_END=1662 /DNA_ORIENTATION=+
MLRQMRAKALCAKYTRPPQFARQAIRLIAAVARQPINFSHYRSLLVCSASEDSAERLAKAAAETGADAGQAAAAEISAAADTVASATESKVQKPRLPYLDSLRFFLIAYIATGHFIAFASPEPFVMKLFSQVNVVVGAFFVLSGYVAAYVATELNEYKASPRIKPAVSYFAGRVAGYYPLYFLVNVLFAPMFLWVDNIYNGPIKAAWHGLITFSLSQAWFPTSAELWNAPTWFLSALTFAMLVLPYALPYIAEWRKSGLKMGLAVLTGVGLLAKVAYTYDLNALTVFEGLAGPRGHPNWLVFNTQRFHPFYAVLEVLMGAVACRLVMTDGAKDGKPEKGALASAVVPLAGMVLLIVGRAAGWITLNDCLTRGLFFIPLFIMFLVRLHRRAVAPIAETEGPGLIASVLSLKPLIYLGSIAFPIYIVHGPIGQLCYKKIVATKLWGGTLNNVFGPWFFGVYWLIVLAAAAFANKFFLQNSAVQSFTKDSVKKVSKAFSG